MIQTGMLATNIVYRILHVIVVFTITVMLSRLAGVAGYGLLSLLIANASIFNLLSAFGADAGITFHAASGRIGTGKLFYFIFAILAFQVIALCVVEFLFYTVTGHMFLLKADNTRYAWVGFVFLLGISLAEKYYALLSGHRMFTLYNRILFFTNLLILAFFSFCLISGSAQPVIFYIKAFVLLNFAQAIIMAFLFHRYSGESPRPIRPAKNDRTLFFSYSIFTFVINTIQFLAYRVDYWILDQYRGSQELGWYSLAVRLSQLFWVIPLLFASILFPQVAAGQEQDESRMQVLVRAMNGVNLLCGFALFLLAPYLFSLVFGDAFSNSVELFRILLPGVILFCIATILAAYFAGQNKLKVNFIGSTICLVCILVLDLWLIPQIGMKGAAIASSISYGVTGLYFLAQYCYSNKVPVTKLIIPLNGDRKKLAGLLSERSKRTH